MILALHVLAILGVVLVGTLLFAGTIIWGYLIVVFSYAFFEERWEPLAIPFFLLSLIFGGLFAWGTVSFVQALL